MPIFRNIEITKKGERLEELINSYVCRNFIFSTCFLIWSDCSGFWRLDNVPRRPLAQRRRNRKPRVKRQVALEL